MPQPVARTLYQTAPKGALPPRSVDRWGASGRPWVALRSGSRTQAGILEPHLLLEGGDQRFDIVPVQYALAFHRAQNQQTTADEIDPPRNSGAEIVDRRYGTGRYVGAVVPSRAPQAIGDIIRCLRNGQRLQVSRRDDPLAEMLHARRPDQFEQWLLSDQENL